MIDERKGRDGIENVFSNENSDFDFSEKWIGTTKDARQKCVRIYKASLDEIAMNKHKKHKGYL